MSTCWGGWDGLAKGIVSRTPSTALVSSAIIVWLSRWFRATITASRSLCRLLTCKHREFLYTGYVGLYFFIAAQIAKAAWPIWIALTWAAKAIWTAMRNQSTLSYFLQHPVWCTYCRYRPYITQAFLCCLTMPGVSKDIRHHIFRQNKEIPMRLADPYTDASITHRVLVGGEGGCRAGKIRAGTTSLMPDHKGFKLQ